MIRLLYISTARTELDGPALATLLRQSRVNNTACGVTGLLIVGGRRFLQVLEGPEDAVTGTYNRISKDPRHFAAVVLSNKYVEERLFPDWAMGYKRGSSASDHAAASFAVTKLIEPISDPTVRAYFQQFAVQHLAA